MQKRRMTPEEAMEIEVQHLKEAAARFGGLLDRDRERRRAAARRARDAFAAAAKEYE